MKIEATRLTVKDAAAIVKRAVGTGTRVTLPALAGVRLTADPDAGTLELAATDLETVARVTIPADVVDAGTVLVDRAAFVAAVANGGDTLTVAASTDDDGRTTVAVGAATLPAMILEDYPALPAHDDGPACSWGVDTLDRLERIGRAASTDEARPVLTGVHLTGTDGGEAAATDSYRLAWGPVDLPADASTIVPARTLLQLVKLKGVDGASVRFGDGQVTFERVQTTGPKKAPRRCTVVLTVRTIEGTFPNYRALLPDPDERAATLELTDPAATAAAATDAARMFRTGNVPLILTHPGGGRLQLAASSRDVGDFAADVPATLTMHGQPIDGPDPDSGELVALNPSFLAAAIRAVANDDNDPVAVHYRDGLKPLVLLPGHPSATPVRVLLMPMRVN